VIFGRADEVCYVGSFGIEEGKVVEVAGCASVASGAKSVLNSCEENAVEFVKHDTKGLLGGLDVVGELAGAVPAIFCL
jgi:hypothetical protein